MGFSLWAAGNRLAVLCLSVVLLTACGQKGALYLPESSSSQLSNNGQKV